MPILNVEIVSGNNERHDLAQLLADAAAEVFDTGPGHTWVKLRFLPQEQYAENGGQPSEIKPVFVSVILGRYGELKERANTAAKLAMSFGCIMERPAENVHVLFEPEAVGRIAFGGKLRTE